jgi:hypothetical protein
MNSDGNTWTTVYSESTLLIDTRPGSNSSGAFLMKLTPNVAGVYTYRIIYDGNSQYAPAVSNVVTLTVTNVAIS